MQVNGGEASGEPLASEEAAKGGDAAAAPPAAAATAAGQANPKSRSVAEVVVEGSWVCPYIASAKKPPPRYEHAVALVGNRMIVAGGNYGGRYLNDAWALNLEDLTWAQLSGPRANAGALPPLAGHASVAWGGQVLVVGGHTKAKDAVPELPVRALDPSTGAWTAFETHAGEGDAVPKPRGGHSVRVHANAAAAGHRRRIWHSWQGPACLLVLAPHAGAEMPTAALSLAHARPSLLQATLIGDRVYVFGGEDVLRRPMGQLLVLDLPSRTWSYPEFSGPAPSPRSAHTAAVYQGRYLLVFGGGSVAHCFNDLYVLDTQSMAWSRPAVEGLVPPPRAGHAGAVLGHTWYMVGGGNNASGCADMYRRALARGWGVKGSVSQGEFAPGPPFCPGTLP